MKRLFSVFLILAILFTCFPFAQAATEINMADIPLNGTKVAIYNPGSELCLGPQEGTVLEGIPSKNGIPGNGALIFDVTYDGSKYYTFENGGKYLHTNDDEELTFAKSQSDNTKWYLEKRSGGYFIYNKAAKYNGKPVCIENYGSTFSGWTFNGSENLFAMKFIEVNDPFDIGFVLTPTMTIKAANAYLGADYSFEVELDKNSAVSAFTMTYCVDGGTQNVILPKRIDGFNYAFSIPASVLAGKTTLTLTGTAKNNYGMQYSANATVAIVDKPLISSVLPRPNSVFGGDSLPEIVATIANCGENPTVTMTLDGENVIPTANENTISYKPLTAFTDGRHSVYLCVTRTDGKSVEMNWSFYIGSKTLNLYYGQMHSHTEYSDGSGSLEEAYEHAMGARDIDFLFVTDHSNYFDSGSTATASSYYDLSALKKSGSITMWEEARATAEKYVRDDFIGMYAYEMTWSGGPGHMNTFNTYGVVSRNNASLNQKANAYAGMHLYYDLMVNAHKGLDVNGNRVAAGSKTKHIDTAPVVSQLNHPGITFGNFDDYAGYSAERDSVINLLEVGNGSGSVVNRSYWPSYSEYDLCLSKGWHIAPTNNQDNHSGRWGDSNTHRNVIVTDEFTQAGIYTAMSERRIYATEDQNLQIYYYVNDLLMGTISTDAPDTVHITANISDPDGEALSKIEIIGEHGISLKSYSASGANYTLDDEFANNNKYYYLKVTQKDGDIAVTAPVWFGATEAPTIKPIEPSTPSETPTEPSEEPTEPTEEPTEPSEEPEEPEEPISNPFRDVKKRDYFYDPVLWAVGREITNGISKTKFAPNEPCTRGQIVTFLWRACGSPEPTEYDNPFSDVDESEYYYEAVLWAVEECITTGLSETEFAPNATCTRAQVATFLWRSRYEPSSESRRSPFSDVKRSDYFFDAVLWAVENDITQGVGEEKFAPDDSCTRGQIVTFLYRANEADPFDE